MNFVNARNELYELGMLKNKKHNTKILSAKKIRHRMASELITHHILMGYEKVLNDKIYQISPASYH